MKKNVSIPLATVLFCLISSLLFFSCGGNKDSAILSAFDAKKGAMKELAGITATANNGVVTLTGECPSADAKAMCEQTVSTIPGVKQVINNCTVAAASAPAPAPVVIAADDALAKGVNDAIKDFPGVSANVKDGEVTLTGEIKRARLQKLMMGLHTLKPKKIHNQLTIR